MPREREEEGDEGKTQRLTWEDENWKLKATAPTAGIRN